MRPSPPASEFRASLSAHIRRASTRRNHPQARDPDAFRRMLRDSGRPGQRHFVSATVAIVVVVLIIGILVVPRLLDGTLPLTSGYDTPRVTSIKVGFTGPLTANDEGVWIDSMQNTRGRRSSLSRIDPDTNKITVGPPAVPAGGILDMDVGDSGLWVTSGIFSKGFALRAGLVQRMDPASMRLVTEVRIRDRLPVHVAVTDKAVWAAGDDRVWRIDPNSARILKRTDMPKLPGNFLASPSVVTGEGTVWAQVMQDTGLSMSRIDPQTNRLVGRVIETGPCPLDAAVGYESMWVLDGCWNAVLRFDRATRHFLAAIPTDGDPSALVLAGGFVWIANGRAGTVTRIDATTNRVAGSPIDVDGVPQHIAAGAGAVWVAPQGDNLVSRIDFEPIN
jgi:DNA-binding beta-propeller fold protein YncE